MAYNIQDLLNQYAYPRAGDNVRSKSAQYEDEVTIAAGQNSYQFFDTSLANIFARNKKLPISGSEIFYITKIRLNLETVIATVARFASTQELLLSSFLSIKVNDRDQIKIPLIKILNFPYALTVGNNAQQFGAELFESEYHLFFPILINSSSNVQVQLYLSSTAATDFDTVLVKCILGGIQVDKLDTFTSNFLMSNQLQNIDYIFYDTNAIASANQTTYELFVQSNTKPVEDQSKYFPLSSIERAQLNKVEVYFFGDDADTDLFNLLYNNRGRNVLSITVDDVNYFSGNIYPFLSLGAVRGSTFSDSGGVNTTNYVNMQFMRQQKIFEKPIIIPANGNQSITLQQPGSSLSVGNNFIVLFDGFIIRQVA